MEWQRSVSVFVGYKEQRMFGERVSVKAFVGCSCLIDSSVERDTASVDLDCEFNSCFVLIGNVIIVSVKSLVYIYLGVITAYSLHAC